MDDTEYLISLLFFYSRLVPPKVRLIFYKFRASGSEPATAASASELHSLGLKRRGKCLFRGLLKETTGMLYELNTVERMDT